MPLHTTVNYDGQLTNQKGIHAFWESQMTEMFGKNFNYNSGEAVYIPDVNAEIWSMLNHTHSLAEIINTLHIFNNNIFTIIFFRIFIKFPVKAYSITAAVF